MNDIPPNYYIEMDATNIHGIVITKITVLPHPFDRPSIPKIIEEKTKTT